MAENDDSVVYDRFQRMERVQSSRLPFFVTAWKPLMPQKPARVAMSDNPLARWEKLAFDLLKSEMREKKINYKELSRRLEALGLDELPDQLNRKVNRRRFSAAFLLACLVAMEKGVLILPRAADMKPK